MFVRFTCLHQFVASLLTVTTRELSLPLLLQPSSWGTPIRISCVILLGAVKYPVLTAPLKQNYKVFCEYDLSCRLRSSGGHPGFIPRFPSWVWIVRRVCRPRVERGHLTYNIYGRGRDLLYQVHVLTPPLGVSVGKRRLITAFEELMRENCRIRKY